MVRVQFADKAGEERFLGLARKAVVGNEDMDGTPCLRFGRSVFGVRPPGGKAMRAPGPIREMCELMPCNIPFSWLSGRRYASSFNSHIPIISINEITLYEMCLL